MAFNWALVILTAFLPAAALPPLAGLLPVLDVLLPAAPFFYPFYIYGIFKLFYL